MQLDKPNFEVPLAASYNERNVAGFTATVTDGLDQRKINSMYEPVTNSITGKGTLYLTKRPGAATNLTAGSSGQVAYLIVLTSRTVIGILAQIQWVFAKSGNDVLAVDTVGASTTIVTASGYVPVYVDKTSISGTETVVLQIRNATFDQRVFYASVIGSWTEITDADFTSLDHAGKAEFIDGYMVVMTTNNRIYNSDLNSLANWSATNYITKQIVQDYPCGLMRFGKQILAFGTRTCEVFVNQGYATGSPFDTVPHMMQRIGIPVPSGTTKTHYYCQSANRLFFVGSSGSTGTASAYSYDGQRFEKVSTPNIDKIIGGNQVTSVSACSINGKAAIAFALDPTTATTQRWLMFFPDWNEWFEWNSTVFTPVNADGFYLGVGTNQHKIYTVGASDNWQDDGTDYTMTHQFQLPKSGSTRKRMYMAGLAGDTARSAQNISVEFSDDDYQSWSAARTIDMTQSKKNLYRCGSYFNRAVRISHAGNTEVRLEKFMARIDE